LSPSEPRLHELWKRNTLGQTPEQIIILLVALSVPLIVQFFLYILASATGASSLPVAGYGIAACSAAACTADGVSVLYLLGALLIREAMPRSALCKSSLETEALGCRDSGVDTQLEKQRVPRTLVVSE